MTYCKNLSSSIVSKALLFREFVIFAVFCIVQKMKKNGHRLLKFYIYFCALRLLPMAAVIQIDTSASFSIWEMAYGISVDISVPSQHFISFGLVQNDMLPLSCDAYILNMLVIKLTTVL